MLAYAQTSSKCNQKDICTVTDSSISGYISNLPVGNWKAGIPRKGILAFYLNVVLLFAFFIICMYTFFFTKTYFKREGNK